MMKSEIRIVSINIWDGKAYIPSSARYDNNGPFTDIEPVYVVNPGMADLLPIILTILSKKPAILPEPTKNEVNERRDLIPKVTGARSWKRLGQQGISYIIELTDKGFLVEMSRLDKKGRWEFDPDKRKTFPPGTDLSILVQAILDDLKTRNK
jgi:hypothetical protein